MARASRGLAALRNAIKHPDRTRDYLRRLRRDAVLRLRHRDHLEYYAAVVSDDLAHGKAKAVGELSGKRWNEIGQMQFQFLLAHGLEPTHRVLEIGCGNLRAGRLIIDHLEAGNYYGVDISKDVLFAAQDTITRYRLTHRLPHMTLVKDMKFAFLPDDAFDIVHAHSVFSHAPLDVIEECFANIGRIMKPTGFFDFTFNMTTGAEFGRLREDFYYRVDTLAQAATRHGLRTEFLDDWEKLGYVQSKMRVRPA
jgi:SAM-dependent methyltransferase